MTISEVPVRPSRYPALVETRASRELASALHAMALARGMGRSDLVREILTAAVDKARVYGTTSAMKRTEAGRLRG